MHQLIRFTMYSSASPAMADKSDTRHENAEKETYSDVAFAAVALDLFQALDVEGVEPPQVSLNGVLLHLITQPRQLILRQLPRPLVLNSL